MPIKHHDNQHRLRQIRIEATKQAQPISETIQRAKAYVEDEVWLSPAELKATIKQLAETLEAMLSNPPQVIHSAEQVASEPTKPRARVTGTARLETSMSAATAESTTPTKSEPAKPTHTGIVLGLKGREDYEAQLVQSGPDLMTDQHGRSFNLKDYGYDEEEAYRLDLSSLREL